LSQPPTPSPAGHLRSAKPIFAERRFLLLALAALVFYAGTLVATWAAHDRTAALGRLAGITAGMAAAALIAVWGRRPGARLPGWAGVGCLALAALIGGYFLLTFDWQASGSGKLAIIRQIGLQVQALRPAIPLTEILDEDINGNVAGGALVILLPLGLGGVAWLWRNTSDSTAWRVVQVLAAGATTLLTLFALLLTASRGAWIALAGSAVMVGYLHLRQRSRRSLGALDAAFFLGFILLLVGGFLAAVAWPQAAGVANPVETLLGSAAGAGGAAVNRAALWRDMLPLVKDYPFTGSGLGGTMMVYSSYVMLLHVGFITHAHHLFLQLAVEQGLPSMLAFAAMVGVGAWGLLRDAGMPQSRRSYPAAAALAGLAALVLHGSVDAGLYVSRLAPVIFLPIGFAAAAWAVPHGHTASDQRAGGPAGRRAGGRAWLLAGGMTVLLLLALLPAARSALQSNLGAVAQTRAELSEYTWPEWPIQDAVRRSGQADLNPAMARYQAALALDPGNASAQRRLGQIEISLGRYDEAAAHLQAAYDLAPQDRANRQLLGESEAISGRVEEAAVLWRTLDLSQNQPSLREWWYNDIGEPQRAQAVAEAARLAGQ
jgi:hypothetical protein